MEANAAVKYRFLGYFWDKRKAWIKKMTVRTMTIDDYEGVKELWLSIRGFAIRSLDDSREGVARFLVRNPSSSVVAVEDGRIVGAILCGHDGRRGCLYHVCVAEEYRMRGIGRQMVVFCMEALKAEQINKVSLIAFTYSACTCTKCVPPA